MNTYDAMSGKRLLILSGPSCVGKSPLIAALNQFHPDVKYIKIPVIKSRESRPQGPRPEETAVWNNPDFFRTKKDILRLKGNSRYLVGNCLGLPQAVDLQKVRANDAGIFFIEIYHTIGAQLIKSTFLTDTEIITVFLSPINREEIEDLKLAGINIENYLFHIMLQKQLVRGRYHGKTIDALFLEDAIGRARDSMSELMSACVYSHVIVNHDGEGSPNWHRSSNGIFTNMPEGDAGRAVKVMANILKNSCVSHAENWKNLKL
jgi:guanylate kinase